MNRQPGGQNQQLLDNFNQKGLKNNDGAPKARNEPIEIPNIIEKMPLELMGLPKMDSFKGIEIVESTTCLIAIASSSSSKEDSKFIVYDMYLKPVLYAHEESGCMSKNCSKHIRDFSLHLCDARRDPILNSSRSGGGYCSWSPDTLETWHKSQQVGVAIRAVFDKYLYLKLAGCNTALAMPTGAGGPFNTCSKPKNNGPFVVSAQGGLKVAEMLRMDGAHLDIGSSAECFMVHFPSNMPVIVKLCILQVAFLINFTSFDAQAGGGNDKKGGGFQKLT